jgi:hypothetical protein
MSRGIEFNGQFVNYEIPIHFNALSYEFSIRLKARRRFVPRRINQILTKYMTGNNSGALLLTTFALTSGRGNDPFIGRDSFCAFQAIAVPAKRSASRDRKKQAFRLRPSGTTKARSAGAPESLAKAGLDKRTTLLSFAALALIERV